MSGPTETGLGTLQLNALVSAKTLVTIHFTNDTTLQSRILWHDRWHVCVSLARELNAMLYKHSIKYIEFPAKLQIKL